MTYFVRRWYQFAVFIAGGYALLLGLGNWTLQQRVLLMGLIGIHLHFFEEFGLPGGFAWGGLKIEMKKVDADVTKWPLNQLSSLFGNIWFALAVYLLPLFVPQWHWTVLAAVIFAYLEFVMHVFVFNLGLKTWYNPGTFTAVFGLTLVSTWYLWQVVPTGLFNWFDLLIAAVWIGINYWFGFRSPVFQIFNRNQRYTFSKEDVEKSARYMQKFSHSIDDYHHFGDR